VSLQIDDCGRAVGGRHAATSLTEVSGRRKALAARRLHCTLRTCPPVCR